MKMVTPYISQEQFDQVFSDETQTVNHVEAFELACVQSGKSNLARAYIELVAHSQSLQAKIDHLMLEHCPEEMTPEQIAEWGRHQKVTVREGKIKMKSQAEASSEFEAYFAELKSENARGGGMLNRDYEWGWFVNHLIDAGLLPVEAILWGCPK